MKKVFNYIMIATATLVLAASCSKNEPPVFSDSNAFVAFDSPTASIAEAVPCLPSETTMENMGFFPQPKHLMVPVTLGSVKGIEETVKFTVKEKDEKGNPLYYDLKDPEGDPDDPANWIDKTAHAGVNFNLVTTSGTLSFDATNRTRYIEFEILYNPEYTGDFKFDIELSKPANVVLGYNKTCTVSISDVNHPLTDLFGVYACTSTIPAGTGANPWTITIKKDDKDDHMIWIDNLMANTGWAGDDTMFYGNVDKEMTTIKIPFGQTSEYKYGGTTPVTLYWVKDDDTIGKTGSTEVKILKNDDGKIVGLDFGKEYGFYCLLEGLGAVGLVYPQITAVKQ